MDVRSVCSSNFDCVNNAECIEGECYCRTGFVANGAVCEDINECANFPCGKNAYCVNTAGTFYCECESGYLGDPFAECRGISYLFIHYLTLCLPHF